MGRKMASGTALNHNGSAAPTAGSMVQLACFDDDNQGASSKVI